MLHIFFAPVESSGARFQPAFLGLLSHGVHQFSVTLKKIYAY
jgi:hypothetical protein